MIKKSAILEIKKDWYNNDLTVREIMDYSIEVHHAFGILAAGLDRGIEIDDIVSRLLGVTSDMKAAEIMEVMSGETPTPEG